MRIVIDMQGAQTESRFRGIGRYTLSFAQAIARNRGEHKVLLALSGLFPITIEPIRAAFDGLLPQENIHVWNAPGPVQEESPGNDARREVAELIREAFLASLAPDVIHISSLFEGYVDDAVISIGRFDRSTAVSVSLYDLIPLLNPDQYLKPNPRYAQCYQRKIEDLKKAASLLAISEFTRQEGLGHLGAFPGSIVNVSTAIEPIFCPVRVDDAGAAQLYRKLGLHHPFILYTGGADKRKNLARLIRAYAALPAPVRAEHQLLLAGKMPEFQIAEYKHLAKTLGLKPDDLCFTGYVTDEDLVQLYNLCKLFVFPSWHEGFGLPALEAMACGAPVIGANTSSLPEVIGLDEALFDPLNVEAITARITQALDNETFRTKLREHGLQQAQRFSWDQTAQRAIAAWEALPKRNAQPIPVRPLPEGKPRLAFVSPMPPERTGIADYSAELLPALAEHYTIEVVVAQDQVTDTWVQQHSKVRDVAWFRSHADTYDRVLYQVGNSPFHRHMLALLQEIPGTVVLHDFYLSGLMAWLELQGGEPHAWTRALYESHGYGAVRDRYCNAEDAKRRYPVNWHMLQHAQGVIVHSEYSHSLAKHWFGQHGTAEWTVIPHLRSPAHGIDKQAARQQLGIDAHDHVICSFGFLDETKQNHRLLQAWLHSALAADKRCRLIFVGENNGGDYGRSLLQTMRASGLGDRIHITGFAASETFRHYLAAADLAVQLRSQSRGETSGTVLDCMNHALPLIVNANGSMAELDPQAVWMLPDELTETALVEALETLWRNPEHRRTLGERGLAVIHERHSPQECARRYAQAIENAHRRGTAAVPALLEAIAAQPGVAINDEAALLHLSQTIAGSLPLPRSAKRLFLDISATCRRDLKTGIERVVRALVMALLESPPDGYRIEPVYLTQEGGAWHHRYARSYTLGLWGCPAGALQDECTAPENGDILLVLDISGDTLVQAGQAGVFQSYRNTGVKLHSIVYDLLPVRMPEVFPPQASEGHASWLRTVVAFDGVVCISKAVADDLAQWRKEAGLDGAGGRPCQIGWWHLGADVDNSAPSKGLPGNAEKVRAQLAARPSFLMVGTIEPRKAYLQTLEAFSTLWQHGIDINLVIVGREGWQGLPAHDRRDIPATIERLSTHPERGQRLFWVDDCSDEYLEHLYAASTCLLAASHGEGFGLPLIEAARHGLPILARDLPVFREVAGAHASYFQARSAPELAAAIQAWLQAGEQGEHPHPEGLPWCTWSESAARLVSACLKPPAGALKNGVNP